METSGLEKHEIHAKIIGNFGSEKMFYDNRMGPQAVCCGSKIYVVFQANALEPFADPYITVYDIERDCWSEPQKVGTVHRRNFDHHLCPVIWLDADKYIHILYGCHDKQGIHIVSETPENTGSFVPCTEIYHSMSYPHIFKRSENQVILYFRVFGHMGYWVYMESNDGGYTWGEPVKLADFDQNPLNDAECWAGSYHNVMIDEDKRHLHIGFTYFDERGIWKHRHPLYKRLTSVNSRYNLYYICFDLETRTAKNIKGDFVEYPLNKRSADKNAMILNTGDYLTMMPEIMLLNGMPAFLAPITEESEWKCGFNFLYFKRGEIKKTRITDTNHSWSGSRLRRRNGDIFAYIISGDRDGSKFTYGAGQPEEWKSTDGGKSFSLVRKLSPDDTLVYNNPLFAVDWADSSKIIEDYLFFYGWDGEHSLQPTIDTPTDIPIKNIAKAYFIKLFE